MKSFDFAFWVIIAIAQLVSAACPTSILTGSLTALLLSVPVSAVNSVKFINHCPYDIFFWAVSSGGSGFQGQDWESITVPNHGSLVHGMVNTEALGSGMTLKLRDSPEYRVAPAGIVQVEYHFEPSTNSVWYDLSTIDCGQSVDPNLSSFCPLVSGGITLHVPGAATKNCPPAWCGRDGCHNVYTKHGSWLNEPTFRCQIGVDVTVETCVESVGPQTFNGDRPSLSSSGPGSKLSKNPGKRSTGGTGGTSSDLGSVCGGPIYGDYCSEYGWCDN